MKSSPTPHLLIAPKRHMIQGVRVGEKTKKRVKQMAISVKSSAEPKRVGLFERGL